MSHKEEKIDVKYVKTKRLCAKEARIQKARFAKAEAKEMVVDNVIFQGVNLNNYLVQPTTTTDLGFDPVQETGVFGDRTPIKPDGINEAVWQQMLVSIRDTIIPQLGARFAAGRARLGLPAVLQDIDLVGTISIPPFYLSFPNDPQKRNMVQYYTSLGWNFEVANLGALLGSVTNPPFAAQFTGTVTGDILTVTDVPYGLVSQGMTISGPGVPSGTMVLDQISKIPADGPFFKNGTYKLNTSLSLSSRQFIGTFPPGPRICTVYIHYGYVEKSTGLVKVKTYDLINRQFEPTIDYNPLDDPACVDSWGEKNNGIRPLSGTIMQNIIDNMKTASGALDPNNTGCVQLVILRETGIITYFPSDCDNRSITTQVTNPNCVSNCFGNADSTSSVTTTVGLDT